MKAVSIGLCGASALALLVFSCVPVPPGTPPPPPEPDAGSVAPPSRDDRARTRAEAEQRRGGAIEVEQPADGKDPLHGNFTLADATAKMPGSGRLLAKIETSQGVIECELYDDKAPITVANFVGLANGLRPFKSHLDGRWVKHPYYDGTTFHRVIKGFMIQGGDPKGNGTGEPGYVIPDEIWPGAKHDRAGLLCMANRGPNTNGAQFFITDSAVPRLDGNYTIFGVCSPTSIVHAIAQSPKDLHDRPNTAVVIDRITVKREVSAVNGGDTPDAGSPP
ncbi:MAG: peptidylprolyl isomerase [Labilithrix sp.]